MNRSRRKWTRASLTSRAASCRAQQALRRGGGFTLIEILVAVAVFAVAGVMAYAGLAAVVRTEQRLDAEQAAFRKITLAVDSLARDLAGAVDRPVRAGDGRSLPALFGRNDRIELTHAGFAGPAALGRSRLERVEWYIDRGDSNRLVRARYLVLDRSPRSVPDLRILHEDLSALVIRYMDHQRQWRMRWPPGAGSDPAPLPLAVEFRLDFADGGEIRRVIELPPSVPAPETGVLP